MMVQEEMVRRASLETGTGKKRVYSGKYALSSIVYCGHCGDLFQRAHWSIHGKKKIVWRCTFRLHMKDSGICCPARTVPEAQLQKAVVRAVNEVFLDQDAYLPQLRENIRKVLGDDNRDRVAELDAMIAGLEQEAISRTRAGKECDDLGRRILELKEEVYRLQLEDAEKEGRRRKVEELEEFLKGGEVDRYDDALVRRLIDRITVRDGCFLIGFKSGIEVEV